VKNIGLAVQMYLADNNDTLPANQPSQEVLEYFETFGGTDPGDCGNALKSNPYTAWPVVLDEYVKNRDVWRCPSAKATGGASQIVPGPDYLASWQVNEGFWSANTGMFGPCYWAWPPGWGGDVTDSFVQQRIATSGAGTGFGDNTANKAFIQSIAVNAQFGVKLAAVQNTVQFVICGDGGPGSINQGNPSQYAWPDICFLDCSDDSMDNRPWCGEGSWGDWDSPDCEAASCQMVAPHNGAFLRDRSLLKPYTRHLGGSNLGFLDGHAAWISAEQILIRLYDGELEGLAWQCGPEIYGFE
jgi:prepilin-type processing-associated H-X9-DG protein